MKIFNIKKSLLKFKIEEENRSILTTLSKEPDLYQIFIKMKRGLPKITRRNIYGSARRRK